MHHGFRIDSDKSAANKRKHGIDFEVAQRLWADARLVEIPARTTDEPRWLLIGKIDEKHWSAIITRRGDNIRLISVRQSRDEEVKLYESEDL
jgi:uncharacterized DUF497 family protein